MSDLKVRWTGSLQCVSCQLLCAAVAIRLAEDVLRRRRKHMKEQSGDIRLNSVFFMRLLSLLRECVPSVWSIELGGVVSLAFLLLLRTKLTLVMARTIGENGRMLVEKKMKSFFFGVADIALLSIPSAVIHVSVQYTKAMLQQRFRDNLQASLLREYLRDTNVYAIATRNMIDNPDHRIAEDAKQFCAELTDIFQCVLKPVIDVMSLTHALSNTSGFAAPSLLFSYYLLVGSVISASLPNFARLVAVSQEKEANLRTIHNQLVQHAEEVAFYGGEEREREHADRLLKSLSFHEAFIKKVKWWGGLLDSLLVKYGAVCVGYIVCGALTLEKRDTMTKAMLTQVYLQTTQLYMPLSTAMGNLLLLRKKVGALCGITHRVGELQEMLLSVSSSSGFSNSEGSVLCAKEEISFSHADICTPDGVVLVKDLSLSIRKGTHVLIMGSNGSGKSALVRTLCQLWPLKRGRIKRPFPEDIVFLPQKVFLPPGTLRAQMIYPLCEDDCEEYNIKDSTLMECAMVLGVAGVVEREGGLNAEKNWHEVLSGGERQRIALIRVLVKRPLFAFLDECTSAVSQDDEPSLYLQLQRAGTTLVTISHREALKPLHDVLLELDGRGKYHISNLFREEA